METSLETSQAKTDYSQNACGERSGYVTPIAVSRNQHEQSSSHYQTSLGAGASSSLSSPCDPSSMTASCSFNRCDLSPGWDDGFIPISSDGDDPGKGSNDIRLRLNSFYSRKRKGSGGWKRARNRGSGKSTAVKVDSKEKRRKKTKGAFTNTNDKSKQMGEGPFSACEQPKVFYSKAMVKNPWNQLKPVVGCILVPLPSARESPRAWLPDSVAVKEHAATCRSDVRTVAQLRSRRLEQDRSLADCLALSFEEAANE